MNIKSTTFPRVLFILSFALLMMSVLLSCGTVEPTIPSIPIASTSIDVTDTPQPNTPTLESTTEQGAAGLLRPSATPAPTSTPGVVSELISEFTHAQGLGNVTFFQIRVEDWLNLGYSILLILIYGFLLSYLVFFVLTKIAARTETKFDDSFIRQIRSAIFTIIITFGFQIGTSRLSLLDAMIKIRLNRLYTAIYVISATVIVWKLVDLLVEWYQKEVEPERADPHQADTLLMLLHRITRALLIMISIIMLLSLYNINVSALIAGLGVGGLAISLAAQDTLSNVISGIMIMVDQPFRVGDRIEIPKMNTWGDVVDIGLRSTRIRTRDNRLVIVPNSVMSTDQVVNYTYPDTRYRIQIEVGIAYGQDIEMVRQIIINSVKQVEGVLSDKPIEALVVAMSDDAITFRARWWIESYRDTRHTNDLVYTALLNSLQNAGIKMPRDSYEINIMKMPGMKNDPI